MNKTQLTDLRIRIDVDALHRRKVTQRPKGTSVLMRALWVLIHLVPGMSPGAFMSNFTTTVGRTVYWPGNDAPSDASVCHTLPHELVHVEDMDRMGRLRFWWSYAMPQVLAVPALFCWLGVWWPWLWLLAAFAVFAGPWPSPGRTRLEMRGYAVTMLMEQAVHNFTYGRTPQHILDHFTTGSYYWMCRDEDRVQAEMDRYLDLINDGKLAGEIPYVADLEKMIQAVKRGD